MSTINLLPWREAHVQIQNRIFFSIVGGIAAIAFLLVYLYNLSIIGKIDWEKKEIRYLSSEISKLDGQIKEIKGLQEQRKLLLERRGVIEQLQGSRAVVVSILDDIAKITPRDTYLLKLNRKEEKLFLEGETKSNARVAGFLKSLKFLPWTKDARLVEVTIKEHKKEGSEEIDVKTAFDIEVLLDVAEDNASQGQIGNPGPGRGMPPRSGMGRR